MKIFHCADIHLDSPLSLLETGKANERRAMLLDEFVSMMKYAKTEKVDLVLIPGDIFDCQYCTAETRKAVISAFELLECPIVIAPGNHDPYYKGSFYADSELPKNVYVFQSEKMTRFDFDEIGVSVHGYAFTKNTYEHNPLAEGVQMSNKNVNLLCAHGDIKDRKSKDAPLSPTELGSIGFTYVALGHLHNVREPIKVGKTTISYCGCACGRGFDELGYGGAYLVEIDQNREVVMRKVTFSQIHFEIETIDVNGLSNDREVAAKIKNLCIEKKYDKNTCLRVILLGYVDKNYTPSPKKIMADGLIPFLEELEIKDKSYPALDIEKLQKDIGIKGEFFRTLYPKLTSDDPLVAERARNALKMGLAALDSREIGFSFDD